MSLKKMLFMTLKFSTASLVEEQELEHRNQQSQINKLSPIYPFGIFFKFSDKIISYGV